MLRATHQVRDAEPNDAARLVALWERSGVQSDPLPTDRSVSVDEARAAVAQIAANPDERLVVAVEDGDVVGAVVLHRSQISPLLTEHVVRTSFLHVAPEYRGRGFGRALMEEALLWAEEKGIARVSSFSPHQDRELNRFLTRLSLGTVASVRLTTAAALRTKLFPESAPRRSHGRRINAVLAARRSQRRRTTTEPE